MIESVYKKKHPATGIIYILINTKDRWIDYQINRGLEGNKIALSNFYETETQPGCFDDYEEIEYIDLPKDIHVFDYMVYSMQNKDQIAIILIPKKLLLNNQDWIKL